MKAAVVHGKGDIRLESVPVPVAGEGEVIVKVRASGICATDIKMLLKQIYSKTRLATPGFITN